MYAPVVSRFTTYGVDGARAGARLIWRASGRCPAMQDWRKASQKEIEADCLSNLL